jgi:hypothetical protein
LDFPSEEDILRDIHFLHELRDLLDSHDAVSLRLRDVMKGHGVTFKDDLPTGWQMDAAEQLEERGFARAPLSHDAQDFSRGDRERDVTQCRHGSKVTGKLFYAQKS